MKQLNPALLLAIITLNFLLSCLTQQEKEVKKYGVRPEWVQKTPLSNSYYYGVGSISKSNPDYKNAAVKSALDQLINEISVVVSSSSTLTTLETNDAFKQEYKQNTQLTALEKIEGYELVESWENDSHYFVFYRLSKAKHKQLKEERTKKAIDRALSNYQSGKERFAEKDYRNSFITFVQGLEILTPVLDEDLTTNINGKSSNIALELLREIRQLEKNFTLTPSFTEQEIKAGSYLSSEQVFVTVTDLNQFKTGNIPITFEYRSVGTLKEKVMSDQSGIARFNIGKIKALKRNQEIVARLDFDQLLGATTKNRIVHQLINLPEGKSVTMNLTVIAPSVYIEGTETLNGNEMNASLNLDVQLRNALLRNQFRIAEKKNEADLELRYEISAQNISNGSQLSVITCTGNIAILENKQIVYAEAIPSQKGSHLSEKGAIDQAYQKITPLIADRIIPKFSGQYFGY